MASLAQRCFEPAIKSASDASSNTPRAPRLGATPIPRPPHTLQRNNDCFNRRWAGASLLWIKSNRLFNSFTVIMVVAYIAD